MRFSAVLAVIALSTTALPVLSRPLSHVYARDYYEDDLFARDPNGELDERGLFGLVAHGASAVAHGVAGIVNKHKKKKQQKQKKDLDELELFEREYYDYDYY